MKIKIFLVALFITTAAYGQTKTGSYDAAIRASKDSVTTLMKKIKIPGLALTVMVNGKIILSEGFGFADLEQKVAVSPSKSRFRIGSISKSLTAAGLAKLYEQKKIILDSSVYFYLPNYPKYKYKPTIRQVAGHLAGVRHYKDDEWRSSKHYNTVDEGLTMFQNDSLLFVPGSKYQYSSYGFNLLSAAMEKAAGKDFLTFITDEVFLPLKLSNTSADQNASIIENRTRFYDLVDGGWVNSPYVDNSCKWAGGGFISSSEDIAVFGNALLDDQFLKKETIQLFATPQKLNNGSATSYGIGFFSGKDHYQRQHFGHSGGSVGGTTDMVIYPDQKIVVVILTNMSAVDLGGISREIANLFIDDGKQKKKK
jgi:serine beta-lactamase-like protein LACTB